MMMLKPSMKMRSTQSRQAYRPYIYIYPKSKKYKIGHKLALFLRKVRRNEAKKTCNAQVEILLLGSTLKVIFGNKLFCALEFAVLGRLAAHQSCANG